MIEMKWKFDPDNPNLLRLLEYYGIVMKGTNFTSIITREAIYVKFKPFKKGIKYLMMNIDLDLELSWPVSKICFCKLYCSDLRLNLLMLNFILSKCLSGQRLMQIMPSVDLL